MNYKYIPLEKKESSNVISLVLLSKLEMSMHLDCTLKWEVLLSLLIKSAIRCIERSIKNIHVINLQSVLFNSVKMS